MIEVTDEMLKVARSMQSFELMIKRIIELHEQSKPKPVGYIYKHRLEQMLNSEVDNDCNFFPIKDEISRVIFNRNRDKYLALYTTPPTREPLTKHERFEIITQWDDETGLEELVLRVERAHGIGVTNA
jgi:hypothetical protein